MVPDKQNNNQENNDYPLELLELQAKHLGELDGDKHIHDYLKATLAGDKKSLDTEGKYAIFSILDILNKSQYEQKQELINSFIQLNDATSLFLTTMNKKSSLQDDQEFYMSFVSLKEMLMQNDFKLVQHGFVDPNDKALTSIKAFLEPKYLSYNLEVSKDIFKILESSLDKIIENIAAVIEHKGVEPQMQSLATKALSAGVYSPDFHSFIRMLHNKGLKVLNDKKESQILKLEDLAKNNKALPKAPEQKSIDTKEVDLGLDIL